MNTAKPRHAQHGTAFSRPAAQPTPPADLAEMRLLRMCEVRSLVNMSESYIRELIAAGQFPAPSYRNGPRCTRWSSASIREWLQSRQEAAQ